MSIDWPNGAGPLPRFRELEAENKRLKAELAAAQKYMATFGPYVDHMWTCPKRDKPLDGECSCGLDAAWKGIAKCQL